MTDEKAQKRGPFDFIDDLSWKKTDLSVDGMDGYSPWLTNRHFAKFVDTIGHANQVNALHRLDPKLQHDYYFHALRSRKRFARKRPQDDQAEVTAALVKFFGINNRKARDSVRVLTAEQKERLIAGVNSIEEEGRNAGGLPRKS